MMSTGASGGSELSCMFMRPPSVPLTAMVTRYVSLVPALAAVVAARTRVSASMSKNGSMRAGFRKSIVPRVTT